MNWGSTSEVFEGSLVWENESHNEKINPRLGFLLAAGWELSLIHSMDHITALDCCFRVIKMNYKSQMLSLMTATEKSTKQMFGELLKLDFTLKLFCSSSRAHERSGSCFFLACSKVNPTWSILWIFLLPSQSKNHARVMKAREDVKRSQWRLAYLREDNNERFTENSDGITRFVGSSVFVNCFHLLGKLSDPWKLFIQTRSVIEIKQISRIIPEVSSTRWVARCLPNSWNISS